MTDPRAAAHVGRIPANAPTHIAEDVKMAFALVAWRKGEDRRRASEPVADRRLGSLRKSQKLLRNGHLAHLGQIRNRVDE